MDILQKIYAPEHFRTQGHALIDLLADYLEAVQTRREPTAIPYQTPENALDYWQKDFEKPIIDDSTALFADVLAHSTRLHHPHVMGHQVPPPAPIAALAGLVSGVLNQGMAVYEMGMVANPMERVVTDFLAQKLGFDAKSNGLLTSGGTLANLTALLAARAALFPNAWTEVLPEKIAVMVSEEAHYCVDRAVRIMGLGSAGIIKIPSDAAFRMRTDLLESYLERADTEGVRVFAIVGSCCSTSTGSHDDLAEIADFAEKHNIWFHADGAHGGAAIFSKKYAPILRGVERADSVVVDFHKMLLTPALATALIFKRGSDSFNTFQQRAEYLWASTEADWYNSGKRTFECTKLMMSLKIYTLLRLYGASAFEAQVDKLYDLGKTFGQIIAARPHFELAVVPDCNIVCFRLTPPNVPDLDSFNQKIREKVIEKGDFYILQTNLRGRVFLRTALMNPLIETQDLLDLLTHLEEISAGMLG